MCSEIKMFREHVFMKIIFFEESGCFCCMPKQLYDIFVQTRKKEIVKLTALLYLPLNLTMTLILVELFKERQTKYGYFFAQIVYFCSGISQIFSNKNKRSIFRTKLAQHKFK